MGVRQFAHHSRRPRVRAVRCADERICRRPETCRWEGSLADAPGRHCDLEHAECLRRGDAAAAHRQWLEAHGRLRSAHRKRDLADVRRRRLRDAATNNQYVSWSNLRGASYMQTPLIYGDYLYSCHVDGILTCFEARTGKQMYKERLGTGGDGYTASPVASEGKIYFTSEQGSVFVLKPGADFSVLAT